jgi:hypothetical protein
MIPLREVNLQQAWLELPRKKRRSTAKPGLVALREKYSYRQSRGPLLRTLKGFLSLVLLWIAWDDQNLMQEVAKMSLYMWQVGLWAGKGRERRKGDNNQMAKNLKAWRISDVESPLTLVSKQTSG